MSNYSDIDKAIEDILKSYGDWKDVINRLSVLLFLEQPFNELL